MAHAHYKPDNYGKNSDTQSKYLILFLFFSTIQISKYAKAPRCYVDTHFVYLFETLIYIKHGSKIYNHILSY